MHNDFFIQAVNLLRENTVPEGILAATPGERARELRYTRIFGRDAAICVPGLLASGADDLQQTAVASLLTLAAHQADNGQIPKYVDPYHRRADFWYIDCTDATLWWLLAVAELRERYGARYDSRLEVPVERALAWLRAREHPQFCLLAQAEAGDWADNMPRSGYVLYTNVLWYEVKKRYALSTQEATLHHCRQVFLPFEDHGETSRRITTLRDYVRRADTPREALLSFVNFGTWGREGDVFANVLAILFGVCSAEKSRRIMDELLKAGIAELAPVRTVVTPILEQDAQWRVYMARHGGLNLPWQYHNGGIWPFIGFFWTLAVQQVYGSAAAQRDWAHNARLCEQADWGFVEWFHGQSGEPLGMRGQSWNAAMGLYAWQALAAG